MSPRAESRGINEVSTPWTGKEISTLLDLTPGKDSWTPCDLTTSKEVSTPLDLTEQLDSCNLHKLLLKPCCNLSFLRGKNFHPFYGNRRHRSNLRCGAG